MGEVLGGGSGCDAMPGGGLDPDGGRHRSRHRRGTRGGRAPARRRSAM